MTETVPRKKPRVHDTIVARLAESIFKGTVKPGETLPSEIALSREYGVSRTAIREALHVLTAKGLVFPRRRVGTVVLDPQEWNYLDPGVLEWARRHHSETDFFRALIEAQLMLEPAVAALAAERATAQEVADLDRTCEAVAHALSENTEAFAQAELDFHLGLFKASHNVIFRQLLMVLRAALEESFRLLPQVILSPRRTIDGHRAVVEAIRLRQTETARRAMTALLETIRDEFTADAASRRRPQTATATAPLPPSLRGEGVPRGDSGLAAQFKNLFGETPTLHRAPGRVTLIGEHTDYTGGLVLPMALDLFAWAAVSPRRDRIVRIHTDVISEPVEFSLDDPTPRLRQDWSDYPHGVAVMLERAGYWLSGANILIRSDIPRGVGLGASASLTVSVGHALCHAAGVTIDPITLARCCQRAENDFVGMRCGIMDPFVTIHGQEQSALLLDCATLDSRPVPLPSEARLVLCNSMVRPDGTSSEYNHRRQECERGLALLSDAIPGLRSLRELSPEDLAQHLRDLPETEFRRCRHIVGENARVLKAVNALEASDLVTLGQLMSESHRSLRNDFQVSCPELDVLVELALATEGVYGARLTGSGFGGCTVTLLQENAVDHFIETVRNGYRQATGLEPDIYPCEPASGVDLWPPSSRENGEPPLNPLRQAS